MKDRLIDGEVSPCYRYGWYDGMEMVKGKEEDV